MAEASLVFSIAANDVANIRYISDKYFLNSDKNVSTRPTMTKLFHNEPAAINRFAGPFPGFSQNLSTRLIAPGISPKRDFEGSIQPYETSGFSGSMPISTTEFGSSDTVRKAE